MQGLEGPWEVFVRGDELSEEWQSRQNIARINDSDSEDSLMRNLCPACCLTYLTLTSMMSRV